MAEITRSRFWRLASIALVAALMVGIVGSSLTVQAYEKDVHYYLTYYVALATCFEPIEAHIIASADRSIDIDEDTYPLPTADDVVKAVKSGSLKKLSRYYGVLKKLHAMDDKMRVQKYIASEGSRIRSLFRASGTTMQNLAEYGVYLHYLQDSFSHEGYQGNPLGHAIQSLTGRDPDSLAHEPPKSHAMAAALAADMLESCAALGRTPRLITNPKDPGYRSLIESMIKASSDKWKLVEPTTRIIISKYKGYGFTKDLYNAILKFEKNLINIELRKAGLPSIPDPNVIDLNPSGAPLLTPAGQLVVKGKTKDPANLVLAPVEALILETKNKNILNLSIKAEVYNNGDNATESNVTLAFILFNQNDEPVLAGYNMTGLYVANGSSLTINLETSMPSKLVSNSSYLKLLLLVGSGNELTYSDNYAVLVLLNAEPQTTTQPPVSTSTSTTNATSTITTITLSSTTKTIYWYKYVFNTQALLAVIAVLLVIILASMVRRR